MRCDAGRGGGARGRVLTASMNDCIRRFRFTCAGASETGYTKTGDVFETVFDGCRPMAMVAGAGADDGEGFIPWRTSGKCSSSMAVASLILPHKMLSLIAKNERSLDLSLILGAAPEFTHFYDG